MGGTYMAETAPGATAAEALETLRARFREQFPPCEEEGSEGWPDPLLKEYVQVWDKLVTEDAVDWMRGWTAQHPPEGVDPDDKWGPWLAFPLAAGGWHFFGWVNT